MRDFGAVGDGKTLDTSAIQRAIDTAAASGGATVLIPPGRYLSGSIFLKSGVSLRLEAGATLLASTNLSDYRTIMPAFRSYTTHTPNPSLIYAEDLTDVSISGEGVIDGQGAGFEYGQGKVRPYVLRFVACRNVRVEGITLRNSPGWMQHYLACDDLTIRGIRVVSHANYNNDMMDIDCCRDVRISDCIGDTGDDAITLKSTANRACENITVTNCIISSHCNAIKFGTESNGGFRNIAITNCIIRPSAYDRRHHGLKGGLAGVALETVDGGLLDRVTVSNIIMTGVKAPLFLRLGNRARPFHADAPRPGIGALRNVVISNIVASDTGNTGCAIAGLVNHPIENVTLENITISMAGGGTRANASVDVDEKADAYPECTMFGVLPAYGFYCRHVAGLRLKNVEVRWTGPDLRPALVCDDVRDLEIDALRSRTAKDAAPLIVLKDVHGAMIRACAAPSGTATFLAIRGDTHDVSLVNNDLAAAAVPFAILGSEAPTPLHQAGNRLKPADTPHP